MNNMRRAYRPHIIDTDRTNYGRGEVDSRINNLGYPGGSYQIDDRNRPVLEERRYDKQGLPLDTLHAYTFDQQVTLNDINNRNDYDHGQESDRYQTGFLGAPESYLEAYGRDLLFHNIAPQQPLELHDPYNRDGIISRPVYDRNDGMYIAGLFDERSVTSFHGKEGTSNDHTAQYVDEFDAPFVSDNDLISRGGNTDRSFDNRLKYSSFDARNSKNVGSSGRISKRNYSQESSKRFARQGKKIGHAANFRDKRNKIIQSNRNTSKKSLIDHGHKSRSRDISSTSKNQKHDSQHKHDAVKKEDSLINKSKHVSKMAESRNDSTKETKNEKSKTDGKKVTNPSSAEKDKLKSPSIKTGNILRHSVKKEGSSINQKDSCNTSLKQRIKTEPPESIRALTDNDHLKRQSERPGRQIPSSSRRNELNTGHYHEDDILSIMADDDGFDRETKRMFGTESTFISAKPRQENRDRRGDNDNFDTTNDQPFQIHAESSASVFGDASRNASKNAEFKNSRASLNYNRHTGRQSKDQDQRSEKKSLTNASRKSFMYNSNKNKSVVTANRIRGSYMKRIGHMPHFWSNLQSRSNNKIGLSVQRPNESRFKWEISKYGAVFREDRGTNTGRNNRNKSLVKFKNDMRGGLHLLKHPENGSGNRASFENKNRSFEGRGNIKVFGKLEISGKRHSQDRKGHDDKLKRGLGHRELLRSRRHRSYGHKSDHTSDRPRVNERHKSQRLRYSDHIKRKYFGGTIRKMSDKGNVNLNKNGNHMQGKNSDQDRISNIPNEEFRDVVPIQQPFDSNQQIIFLPNHDMQAGSQFVDQFGNVIINPNFGIHEGDGPLPIQYIQTLPPADGLGSNEQVFFIPFVNNQVPGPHDVVAPIAIEDDKRFVKESHPHDEMKGITRDKGEQPRKKTLSSAARAKIRNQLLLRNAQRLEKRVEERVMKKIFGKSSTIAKFLNKSENIIAEKRKLPIRRISPPHSSNKSQLDKKSRSIKKTYSRTEPQGVSGYGYERYGSVKEELSGREDIAEDNYERDYHGKRVSASREIKKPVFRKPSQPRIGFGNTTLSTNRERKSEKVGFTSDVRKVVDQSTRRHMGSNKMSDVGFNSTKKRPLKVTSYDHYPSKKRAVTPIEITVSNDRYSQHKQKQSENDTNQNVNRSTRPEIAKQRDTKFNKTTENNRREQNREHERKRQSEGYHNKQSTLLERGKTAVKYHDKHRRGGRQSPSKDFDSKRKNDFGGRGNYSMDRSETRDSHQNSLQPTIMNQGKHQPAQTTQHQQFHSTQSPSPLLQGHKQVMHFSNSGSNVDHSLPPVQHTSLSTTPYPPPLLGTSSDVYLPQPLTPVGRQGSHSQMVLQQPVPMQQKQFQQENVQQQQFQKMQHQFHQQPQYQQMSKQIIHQPQHSMQQYQVQQPIAQRSLQGVSQNQTVATAQMIQQQNQYLQAQSGVSRLSGSQNQGLMARSSNNVSSRTNSSNSQSQLHHASMNQQGYVSATSQQAVRGMLGTQIIGGQSIKFTSGNQQLLGSLQSSASVSKPQGRFNARSGSASSGNKGYIKYRDEAEDDSIQMLCTKCDKAYLSDKVMRRHAIWHDHVEHGIRDRKCDQCQQAFQSIGELHDHNLDKHSYDSWSCDVCDVTFFSSQYLLKHMEEAKHESIDSKMMCSLCPATFRLMKHLILHKRDKHSDNSEEFGSQRNFLTSFS